MILVREREYSSELHKNSDKNGKKKLFAANLFGEAIKS